MMTLLRSLAVFALLVAGNLKAQFYEITGVSSTYGAVIFPMCFEPVWDGPYILHFWAMDEEQEWYYVEIEDVTIGGEWDYITVRER
jgi:hypothetical protein